MADEQKPDEGDFAEDVEQEGDPWAGIDYGEGPEIDPDFSRWAAQVVHSPYFTDVLREGVEDPQALQKELWREQDLLLDALGTAKDYDALPSGAREVFDRAWQYTLADELEIHRFGTEPLGLGISAEAAKLRGVDPETSEVLAAAIAQATASGDKKGAAWLASLAHTPEKVYEALDQGGAVVRQVSLPAANGKKGGLASRLPRRKE